MLKTEQVSHERGLRGEKDGLRPQTVHGVGCVSGCVQSKPQVRVSGLSFYSFSNIY